jgi:hypothetical protein
VERGRGSALAERGERDHPNHWRHYLQRARLNRAVLIGVILGVLCLVVNDDREKTPRSLSRAARIPVVVLCCAWRCWTSSIDAQSCRAEVDA